MEVYTGRLIPKLVIHVDDDGIADVGLQQGTWPCSIDTNDWPRVSIGRSGHPGDVPVDFNGGGACEADRTQEQKKNVWRIHHSTVDVQPRWADELTGKWTKGCRNGEW